MPRSGKKRRLEERKRRSLRTAKGLRWEKDQWGDLGRIFAGGREGLRALLLALGLLASEELGADGEGGSSILKKAVIVPLWREKGRA